MPIQAVLRADGSKKKGFVKQVFIQVVEPFYSTLGLLRDRHKPVDVQGQRLVVQGDEAVERAAGLFHRAERGRRQLAVRRPRRHCKRKGTLVDLTWPYSCEKNRQKNTKPPNYLRLLI